MTRVMPAQRPGESEQVVGTPTAFLASVARRFGPLRWDLAANATNAVVPGAFYGPGSPHGEDTLKQPWYRHNGVLWLNPEFEHIDPYAEKCMTEGEIGARPVMLVPASVGTLWWKAFVHQKAFVLFIRPRLTFVGHTDAYPKDLALCCYGPWVPPGYDTWEWDHPELAAAR